MKKILLATLCIIFVFSCDGPEVQMKNNGGVIYKKEIESYNSYKDTSYFLYVTAIKTGQTYKVEVNKIVFDSTDCQNKFHITERISE
jgi:hypothetical protein